MRLFCAKCDKEIKDFELIRTEHSECGFSYHTIGIRCHGDKSIQGVSSRNKRFNTSDYGDFYFFKKEPLKASDELLTWTKDKPTKPGWYWYRGLYQVQSSIIYIAPNIDIVNSLKGSKGEWAGPIPEPVEVDDIRPGKQFEITWLRSCCKTWKNVKLPYYRIDGNCEGHAGLVPTYCPECGRKL